MPLSAQIATVTYFQQAHSNHRATLRCLIDLPYLSSGMPQGRHSADRVIGSDALTVTSPQLDKATVNNLDFNDVGLSCSSDQSLFR